MSEEKKVTELNEEELKDIAGGSTTDESAMRCFWCGSQMRMEAYTHEDGTPSRRKICGKCGYWLESK